MKRNPKIDSSHSKDALELTLKQGQGLDRLAERMFGVPEATATEKLGLMAVGPVDGRWKLDPMPRRVRGIDLRFQLLKSWLPAGRCMEGFDGGFFAELPDGENLLTRLDSAQWEYMLPCEYDADDLTQNHVFSLADYTRCGQGLDELATVLFGMPAALARERVGQVIAGVVERNHRAEVEGPAAWLSDGSGGATSTTAGPS